MTACLTYDEERELLGDWLERRMFGWMLGGPFTEERTAEEFFASRGYTLGDTEEDA